MSVMSIPTVKDENNPEKTDVVGIVPSNEGFVGARLYDETVGALESTVVQSDFGLSPKAKITVQPEPSTASTSDLHVEGANVTISVALALKQLVEGSLVSLKDFRNSIQNVTTWNSLYNAMNGNNGLVLAAVPVKSE